ncbi:cytidine deaminase [Marispirochaeta aestuarii]|jgi:homotetrameric cytidine deaminase|uniref:Cytidine deaminase n=1 Tax=Marispirochaeta aestuarii TaxID=1963862 RepID=A0A1Y1RW32_9SPIO|nr:cytidine deaminase [Marispirochaeta aestuarii]ORC32937.1 cytidine deaminase [Marispirochaeta aestuarii]
MEKEPDIEQLVTAAAAARNNAHTPYSRFKVGAALLLADGSIRDGCNIENASYGATVCAERVAILKARSEDPEMQIQAIAVVTQSETPSPPCALCLQVMAEFCSPETPIILANTSGKRLHYRFDELLPHPFTQSLL